MKRSQTLFFAGASVVIVIALVIAVSLSVRISRLQRTVTSLTESLGTELERQNELAQFLESNQRTATGQLQEVRRLLNLPTAEFRFPDSDATPETARHDPSTRFFQALDRLVLHHEHRRIREKLDTTFADSGDAVLLLRDRGLQAVPEGRAGSWRITARGPDAAQGAAPPFVTVTIGESGPPANVTVTPLAGEAESLAFDNDESFSARLVEVLGRILPEAETSVEQYEEARSLLVEASRSAAVRDALRAQDLTGELSSDTFPASFAVRAQDQGTLLTVEIDRRDFRILVDGTPIDAEQADPAADRAADPAAGPLTDQVAHRIAGKISALTPPAPDLEPDEQGRDKVQRIARDPAFQDYLDQRGVHLAEEPRETLGFYVFELTDRAGTLLGSFGVQKLTGELYLLDEDDLTITGLDTLERDTAALRDQPVSRNAADRALPEEFPAGFRGGASREGTDLLLIGTHEAQADAIMLLHLSPDRTISMISIPRDLYYNGRKLSHHQEIYGTQALVRRIGEITGRQIDAYVAIEMYAFIEVVNILGGITLTLEEPLIDPTYRVRDDGEWGTLHYPAGTYSLNGIEALRIARSRATTNDFDRALRQQKILNALRHRINELHAGNLNTVYQLFRTLYEYVDTDLGAWELTQYFLAYRNAPIANRTGMTFDNILYATYSNVHNRGLTLEEAQEIEDFYYGLWILLPREDDWNVIPWFVEQNIRS